MSGLPTTAFNLRVIAPDAPLQLAVTARAGLPMATFNLRSIAPPFTLSDFDDTGLEVVFAALIESGTVTNDNDGSLYSTSDTPWGVSGVLLDGDLNINTGRVTRVYTNLAATFLRLNDSGALQDNVNLGSYFDDADNADLSLYLQTATLGPYTRTVTNQGTGSAGSGSGDWQNFTVSGDFQTLLDGLVAGDRFIFAMARPEAIPTQQLAMTSRAGLPTAVFNARVIAPAPVLQLAMTARTGLPTADFNLRALAPSAALQLAMMVRSGLPTAAFNARTVAPAPALQLALSVRAGLPTAVFSLRTVAPGAPLQLAIVARAGLPTTAFNLRTIAPAPVLQLAIQSRAGLPTSTFNARVIAPLPPLQLAMTARAGLPTAAFDLRTLAPSAAICN